MCCYLDVTNHLKLFAVLAIDCVMRIDELVMSTLVFVTVLYYRVMTEWNYYAVTDLVTVYWLVSCWYYNLCSHCFDCILYNHLQMGSWVDHSYWDAGCMVVGVGVMCYLNPYCWND